MKKRGYALIILAAMLAIPAALSAQTTGMWVKVPFPFAVSNHTLPAGDYFVEGLYWNAVAFHEANGKANVIELSHSRGALKPGAYKLVFRNYEGHYFLAEARLPGMDSAREFTAGKVEKEVAQSNKQSANVEVAGLLKP